MGFYKSFISAVCNHCYALYKGHGKSDSNQKSAEWYPPRARPAFAPCPHFNFHTAAPLSTLNPQHREHLAHIKPAKNLLKSTTSVEDLSTPTRVLEIPRKSKTPASVARQAAWPRLRKTVPEKDIINACFKIFGH